ncbi:Hypothetical predicted protein [Paramuricea clavata]|uniref:Uncharacterized protein n=1 Tax=Paramuricea clavata TaxID=317549 RepID=A0A6S7FL59_PARCT|nr:Hypothetical predicted protein [Paramuricea clavata]
MKSKKRSRKQGGGNFKGGKHQRSSKKQDGGLVGWALDYGLSKKTKSKKSLSPYKRKQRGGGPGMAMAAGLAIPTLLGAATKILPGIFGKKKTTGDQ